jgi:hypothetical protein
VAVELGGTNPPKANADVDDPAPPKSYLAVFKSFVSVHIDPFHSVCYPCHGRRFPPNA